MFTGDFGVGLILFILGIQFIAGFIKTIAGFGNGAISGPILALRLDTSQITASNGIVDLPLNGYFAFKYRRSYKLKKYMLYAAVIAAGGLMGAFLLKFSPPWILKILVGIFVIGLGVKMLFEKNKQKKGMKEWLKIPFFLLGGFTGGLFGINVFFVPEFRRMADTPEEFKGSVCFTYALDLLIRVPVYIIMGIITWNVVKIALTSAAGLALGMAAGSMVEKRINQRTAEVITMCVMILGGLSVIAKTLLSLAGII